MRGLRKKQMFNTFFYIFMTLILVNSLLGLWLEYRRAMKEIANRER